MTQQVTNLRLLWIRIEALLDSRRPTWRTYVHEMGQLAAVESRSSGRIWSDDDVFEALLMAVLSSNTDWSKIQRIQGRLADQFSGFSLRANATVSETDISSNLVPWFKREGVDSQSLRKNLFNLVLAARKLLDYGKIHGSADRYFTSLMRRCNGDPKQVARLLGHLGEYKLPSLGIPLAAEALKNLGFDVGKPDRHIMRAVGAFGLADFSPWKYDQDPKPRGSPDPTPRRQCSAMEVLEEIAFTVEQRVTLVDNAIWLLCERGGKANGLYLTNA